MALSIGSGISIGGGISLSVAPTGPTTIGEFYGGGYYVGKISTTQTGVADYYLIVAPFAYELYKQYCTASTMTGIASPIDGPGNTAALVALGTTYEAGYYCGVTCNAAGGINGYADWYLPAYCELEVAYYNLKPGTVANVTFSGNNPYAVPPEPFDTVYTAGAPAQTTVALFQTGGAQAFGEAGYWSSTESFNPGTEALNAWYQYFLSGDQYYGTKQATWLLARPFRRIPI